MMPQMDFFPQRPAVHPMIYAYRDLNPDYDGLLKVGYTEKDVDRRVAQQYPTKRPDGKLPYEILYRSSAMREDGSCFTDHDVHRMLRRRKITGVGGEWFRCTVDELEAAVLAVKTDTINEENRTRTFPCARSRRRPSTRPSPIFVPPSWIRRTVHRNSSGMPKCASAKPSPPMSWPNEWG